MTTQKPDVTGYYHDPSGSIAYLVVDPAGAHAAVIDPVLDYDEKSGRVSTQSADAILADIAGRKLKIGWILDTHPHADHLSAAGYFKDRLGAPTAIGEKVTDVQKVWREKYNIADFPTDGKQWDRLFADGDTFSIGIQSCRSFIPDLRAFDGYIRDELDAFIKAVADR